MKALFDCDSKYQFHRLNEGYMKLETPIALFNLFCLITINCYEISLKDLTTHSFSVSNMGSFFVPKLLSKLDYIIYYFQK